MARFFISYVHETLIVKVVTLCTAIVDKFGYVVTKGRIWYARRKAIAMVYGDWDESYNELLRLLNALRVIIPGTIIELCPTPSCNDVIVIFQLDS